MNKTLYRVIFNRNRGQRMVVPEHTKREGKGAGTGVGEGTPGHGTAHLFGARLRSVSFFTLLALGSALILPTSPALAQGIRADANAPAHQQPNVTQASNGVPQVDIQRPSPKDVSMNQYSQFDVGEKGGILQLVGTMLINSCPASRDMLQSLLRLGRMQSTIRSIF